MLALSLFFLLLIRVVNGDDEDDLVFELTSDRPRFGFHGTRLSRVKTITIRVGNEVSYEIGYTQNGCNNLDTENGNVKCDDKPPFTIVDVALESPKTGSRVYGVVPSGRGTVFTWIWQVNARSELIFQAPPFGDSSSLEYSVTVQINDDNGEIIPSFPGLRNNEVNSPLTFSVLFQYGTIIANPETYDEIKNGPLVMVKALHSGNVDDFCPGQSIECHPDTIFSFYAGPMPIPIGPETLNDEFLLTKVRGGVPVYSRNTVTTVTTTNGCSFCLVFDTRAAREYLDTFTTWTPAYYPWAFDRKLQIAHLEQYGPLKMTGTFMQMKARTMTAEISRLDGVSLQLLAFETSCSDDLPTFNFSFTTIPDDSLVFEGYCFQINWSINEGEHNEIGFLLSLTEEPRITTTPEATTTPEPTTTTRITTTPITTTPFTTTTQTTTTPPAWYCGMTYRLSYEKSPSIAFPSSDLYSLAAVNPIQSICIETCETCSLSIHFTYYCQSKEECQLNDEMPFVINLNNQSQWDTECKTSATSSNGSFFLSCEATINKNQLILSWNMKKYSQNGLPIEKSAVLIVVPELLVDNHQYIVLPNEAPIVNLEESEKPISVVLVIGNGEWQSLKGLTSNSSGKCTFGLSPFSPSNRTDVDGNIMEINGNGGSFVEQYLTSRIYTVLIPPKCSTKIAIQPLKSVSKRIEQSLCNGTTMITTPGYMNSWNVFDKEDFISYQIYCDNSPIDVLVKVMNLYDGILSIETKSEHKEETGKETVLFSDYYEWPKAFQYENITNIIIDWLSTNSSIHDGAFVFVTVEMSDDEKTTMMTTTSEVEKKKRQFFWIFIGAIGLIILIIISLTLCCIHGVKSGAFLRVLLRVSSVDPAIVEQVHKRLYHSQRKARKAEWKRSNGNANEHQFEGKPAEDIHL